MLRDPIAEENFMKRKTPFRKAAQMVALLLWPVLLHAGTPQGIAPARPAVPDSTLLQQHFGAQDVRHFSRPPRIFYPETWFHLINGNISRRGIAKDLQAIAEAGITGVQLFHGQMGNPADWPGTEEHIECLSPKWEELVRYTATEAHRLGLRFSLQTCPGWAMSGGPWIQPEQAMRHLRYSRTDVGVGLAVDTLLPCPATTDWQDWRDIMVLAFPTPANDADRPMAVADVRSAEPEYQQSWTSLLQEGKDFILSPTTDDHPHRVQLSLAGALPARSLVFNPIDNFNHEWGVQPDIHLRVMASGEGVEPRMVLDTDFPRSNWQDSEVGMTFALADGGAEGTIIVELVNRHPMHLSQMHFLSAVRGHNWEAEAGWTLRSLLRPAGHPGDDLQANGRSSESQQTCLIGRVATDEGKANVPYYVRRSQMLDISSCMDAEGHLRWLAPATADGVPVRGGWTILRIGHVNTGQRNGPAPPEATGWEVNKLDTNFVGHQFRSYIGRLANGPLYGLIDNMLMDSWECRTQTWTRNMEHEFRQRRHYDLRRWIPALFGYVIDDREQTAEFLCDWRRTQNELFTDNFYGYMSRLAHEQGMTVSFETAAGDIFPADPLQYYKHADVPMTEFWQPFSHWLSNHNYKPLRPTASAARMYGKPRVTAEAFTSFDLTWDEHLSMLREVANQNLLEGVTHMVFHTYTHNPDADNHTPGTSFGGAIGTPFLRRQTWWGAMPHFTTYLARVAYMLERGRPVSAVLWFLGDEVQHKPDQYAPFPAGYRYDYCNTDALLHRVDVKDGLWVTPEGIRYDVLWIPEQGRLTAETLERLAQLVRKGGRMVAEPPVASATWIHDDVQGERFRHAVERLWGERGTASQVLSHTTLDAALKELAIRPDVKPTPVGWLHRQAEGADWYMVCPPQGESFKGEVSFLQQGRAELWNPMTGRAVPIPVQTDGNYTRVALKLACGECVFVVFPHDGLPVAAPTWSTVATTMPTAPWTLTFDEGWGIDSPVTVQNLCAWKDLPLTDEGRTYSGTVTYDTRLRLAHRPSKSSRYVLSLGRVEEIAVVEVNGHVCDTLWAAPYEVDVTPYVRKGDNRIRLRVTSTWYNRLAYDAALPEAERRTWVVNGPAAGSPLRESGLLGPVVLREERR